MNADGLAPPEVFVSYARKNRPVAEQLAAGLGASGLRVWWDSDLWAGAEFASVIEAQLRGVAVATRLLSFGYEAPGIELVGECAPGTTQVRVQGKSDRSYARWVGKVVGEAVNAVPAQRQAAARHQRNLVRSTLERTRRVVDGRVQGGVAR